MALALQMASQAQVGYVLQKWSGGDVVGEAGELPAPAVWLESAAPRQWRPELEHTQNINPTVDGALTD